jgi:hypothetical protein
MTGWRTSSTVDVAEPEYELVRKLTASDGSAGDAFGYGRVAVDGDTAVIAARDDDDNGPDSGSAYVFTRSGGSWSQEAKLTAQDGAAGDYFGQSVAVQEGTVLVGSWRDDDKGMDSGSVYVFRRSDGSWQQQTKLVAPDGDAGDSFGVGVSLHGDTAVVGANNDDDKGTSSGSAYVFRRSGESWSFEAKLTASDGSPGDVFGSSEAVAIDSDTILIGAYRAENGTDSGAAYVFSRSNGSWQQQAKLTAGDAAAGDFFGASVELDGDTAIVGANQDDDSGTNSGSVYVFSRSNGSWQQQAKLTPDDGAPRDDFGVVVALDSNTAVVGCRLDDDNGFESGSAYVFTQSDGTWDQRAKLLPPDGASRDFFGRTVTVDGNTILVGSPGDDDEGNNSGSTYVFERELFPEPISLPGKSDVDPADLDGDGRYEDLNGDGEVSGQDLSLFTRLENLYRRGEIQLTGTQVAAFDFDGDGAFTKADVRAFRRELRGG